MEKVHEHAPLTVDVQDVTNWDWDRHGGEEPPSKTYDTLGPMKNCQVDDCGAQAYAMCEDKV